MANGIVITTKENWRDKETGIGMRVVCNDNLFLLYKALQECKKRNYPSPEQNAEGWGSLQQVISELYFEENGGSKPLLCIEIGPLLDLNRSSGPFAGDCIIRDWEIVERRWLSSLDASINTTKWLVDLFGDPNGTYSAQRKQLLAQRKDNSADGKSLESEGLFEKENLIDPSKAAEELQGAALWIVHEGDYMEVFFPDYASCIGTNFKISNGKISFSNCRPVWGILKAQHQDANGIRIAEDVLNSRKSDILQACS